MTSDDFAAALRLLDAPYLLDGEGHSNVVGIEYLATSHDGLAVTITRLHDELTAAMRSVDDFVGTLGSRTHRTTYSGGLIGAGVTLGGAVFVVGPRTRNGSLAERLSTTGNLTSGELRDLAIRAAALLEEVCREATCHGLIMPASVLVSSDNRVVLRWGGLFTALRASGIPVLEIGQLLRFTSYLAPELLSDITESAQTDVFSLGATLYEALTGRPPFGGRTTATVMAAVLADAGEVRQSTESERIRQAILRAIEQDPRDRWADAQQFRAALAPPAAESEVPPIQAKGCLSLVVLVICALVAYSIPR
jgi:serine/threonine protein kinase